jgi:hypothetical protein
MKMELSSSTASVNEGTNKCIFLLLYKIDLQLFHYKFYFNDIVCRIVLNF